MPYSDAGRKPAHEVVVESIRRRAQKSTEDFGKFVYMVQGLEWLEKFEDLFEVVRIRPNRRAA